MESSLILIAIAFTMCIYETVCKEIPTFSKIEDCPRNLIRDLYLKVYNDTCYHFHKSHKNAIEASKLCHDSGGYLVTVKSKEVNDFIQNWRRSFDDNDEEMWIGLVDRGMQYVWADGASLEYKNFEMTPGSTDTSSLKDCVVMNKLTGKWDEEVCDQEAEIYYKNPFICEFRPEGITTTDPANKEDYTQLGLQQWRKKNPIDLNKIHSK